MVLAGYYRVSTDGQADGTQTRQRYEKRLLSFVAFNGERLDKRFLFDDVASGGDRDREGLGLLMEAIKTHPEITGLVVPEQSRLARDTVFFLETLQPQIIDNGLQFYEQSLGRFPVDLTSPDGRYQATVKAAESQRMREYNKAIASKGWEDRRNEQRVKTAPFGYKLNEEEKLEPDMREYSNSGMSAWQFARGIVDYYLANKGWDTTSRWLRSEWSHVEPRRHPQSTTGVKNWLTSDALAGHTVYFLAASRLRKEHPDYHPKELIYDTHDPLLTRSEYQQISQNRTFSSRAAGDPHRLHKLLFCSACNGPLMLKINKKKGKRYDYLKCKNAHHRITSKRCCGAKKSWPYEHIESQIIEQLKRRSTQMADMATVPAGEVENTEVLKLREEIAAIKGLGISGMESQIEIRQKKIANLTKKAGDYEIDHELRKEYQAAILEPRFWAVAPPEALAVVYRTLLSGATVELSSGRAEASFL